MNRICWTDTETTGVSADKNDVVQIAGLIEEDGAIVMEFDIKCRPHNPENAHPGAFAVNGLSLEEVNTWNDPKEEAIAFRALLSMYNDDGDTLTLAGYNVGFDLRMIEGWLRKGGLPSTEDLFEYKPYDVFPLFKAYAKGLPEGTLPNNKLVTAAKHFGLAHNAHEAMSDIKVTREIGIKLEAIMKRGAEQ